MKILIDNGHGIETSGKRSPDGLFLEYAYTREIASMIVTALQENGYDAQLLVPENEDIPPAVSIQSVTKSQRQRHPDQHPCQCLRIRRTMAQSDKLVRIHHTWNNQI